MTAQTQGRRRAVQEVRTFYLDASALVKRYLAETGSAWVESVCADEETNAIAIAHFGLVETAAAFAAKQRGGFITPVDHETMRTSPPCWPMRTSVLFSLFVISG